jgi:hypothetical protein
MTTNYHTVIATGAAANASVINAPLAQLDAAVTLQGGGDTASASVLSGWTTAGSYEVTGATYDGDGVLTTATVKWPDGSAGTLTTVTKNTTWLAIDAYTITHTDSSQTVTQAAVTRDTNGNITTKPALTVA